MCMRVCVCARVCARVCVHVCMCVSLCVNVCTYTYAGRHLRASHAATQRRSVLFDSARLAIATRTLSAV